MRDGGMLLPPSRRPFTPLSPQPFNRIGVVIIPLAIVMCELRVVLFFSEREKGLFDNDDNPLGLLWGSPPPSSKFPSTLGHCLFSLSLFRVPQPSLHSFPITFSLSLFISNFHYPKYFNMSSSSSHFFVAAFFFKKKFYCESFSL